MLYLLIIADLLMAGSFLLKFTHLPPEIPLFYSRSFGEDQLAEIWYIFVLPILIHVIIFLNYYIYNRFYIPDQLVKKIIDIINWSLIIALTLIFIRTIFFIS